MFDIREVDSGNIKRVLEFVKNRSGSDLIVSRGREHFVGDLKGFLIYRNEEIMGLVTYNIEGNECEIVSLDSFAENIGVGGKLIGLVQSKATQAGCSRVLLITTNDNTRALRFYQKRGYTIVDIHLNAIQKSREIKPQIPEYGFDNIPILHEIELEKTFKVESK